MICLVVGWTTREVEGSLMDKGTFFWQITRSVIIDITLFGNDLREQFRYVVDYPEITFPKNRTKKIRFYNSRELSHQVKT